jgi:hypothetical protein
MIPSSALRWSTRGRCPLAGGSSSASTGWITSAHNSSPTRQIVASGLGSRLFRAIRDSSGYNSGQSLRLAIEMVSKAAAWGLPTPFSWAATAWPNSRPAEMLFIAVPSTM